MKYKTKGVLSRKLSTQSGRKV